ncbi:hypothetical protein TrLO_g2706 [Triparma laevis f. longispina]|nr:hypothetical protein TrLO_g2706 [Triparma laevis f. longispina]
MLTTPTATAAARSPPTPKQEEIDKYLKSALPEQLAFEMFDDEADYKFDSLKFRRLDSTEDSLFYDRPKLVEHIDERAVEALTKRNNNLIETTGATKVLDLCASHVSHLKGAPNLEVVGVGMNEDELKLNPVLTKFDVIDLNKKPALPYASNSFDLVLCQLSVDYLTRPIEVFEEVARVLKPGGTFSLSFSNRVFMSKQVAVWSGQDDFNHILTVSGYFAMSARRGGAWDVKGSLNANVLGAGGGDPIYDVVCQKYKL